MLLPFVYAMFMTALSFDPGLTAELSRVLDGYVYEWPQ
jgi:hypothetical protein